MDNVWNTLNSGTSHYAASFLFQEMVVDLVLVVAVCCVWRRISAKLACGAVCQYIPGTSAH